MKLKIICKVLIVLLIISCKKEHSKIVFETKIIDIGKIRHDTIIDVFFKFKNTNDKKILKIEKVTSDCHCTVARDYQKNIKPNQTGEIKINYHSKGFGYFEQLIEVFSNAKNSPSLLIIKGRVDSP